jgi:hypothetical protein
MAFQSGGARRPSLTRGCVVAGCSEPRFSKAGYCSKHQGAVTAAAAAPAWVADEDANSCAGCRQPIVGSLFSSGKHHCRRCGLIFCASCTSHRRALPDMGLVEPQRVCDACFDFQDKKAAVLLDDRRPGLQLLEAGQVFMKHAFGKVGNPHPRFVQLTPDHQRITWHAVGDTRRVESLPLASVLEVRPGQASEVFGRSGKAGRDAFCFSIVTTDRTLDLEADSKPIRDAWVTALKESIEFLRAETPEQRRQQDDKLRATEKHYAVRLPTRCPDAARVTRAARPRRLVRSGHHLTPPSRASSYFRRTAPLREKNERRHTGLLRRSTRVPQRASRPEHEKTFAQNPAAIA